MSRCFLDTCAVLDMARNRGEAIAAVTEFDEIYIGHVVLGELLFGCHWSSNFEREWARISQGLASVTIVMPTMNTAMVYGELAARLERSGSRITQNDMWIAAMCLENELPLISRDTHFARVQDLRLVSY